MAGAVLVAVTGLPGAPARAAGVLAAGEVTAARAVPVPTSSGQWWFRTWRIGDVWAAGARGQGVTVAVLDNGVDASRPELAGHVLPGLNRGGDRIPEKHGSSMATLIVGQGVGSGKLVGVAPDAQVLPVNSPFLGDSVSYAVAHGAKVVSISLGEAAACDPIEGQSIAKAVRNGAVVVVSAGNDGATKSGPQSPASCPGALTIGAVDQRNHVPSFSSPGPWVDLGAPGVAMLTKDGDRLAVRDGTSGSAALVAGVVALVWSKYPALTNRQVVARILATARDDADRPGHDNRVGYGIVQPLAAVTASVPADAPNPVYDALGRASGADASASPSTTSSRPWPPSPTPPAPAGAAAPSSAASEPAPPGDGVSPLLWALLAVAGTGGVGLLVLALRSRARPVPDDEDDRYEDDRYDDGRYDDGRHDGVYRGAAYPAYPAAAPPDPYRDPSRDPSPDPYRSPPPGGAGGWVPR